MRYHSWWKAAEMRRIHRNRWSIVILTAVIQERVQTTNPNNRWLISTKRVIPRSQRTSLDLKKATRAKKPINLHITTVITPLITSSAITNSLQTLRQNPITSRKSTKHNYSIPQWWKNTWTRWKIMWYTRCSRKECQTLNTSSSSIDRMERNMKASNIRIFSRVRWMMHWSMRYVGMSTSKVPIMEEDGIWRSKRRCYCTISSHIGGTANRRCQRKMKIGESMVENCDCLANWRSASSTRMMISAYPMDYIEFCCRAPASCFVSSPNVWKMIYLAR